MKLKRSVLGLSNFCLPAASNIALFICNLGMCFVHIGPMLYHSVNSLYNNSFSYFLNLSFSCCSCSQLRSYNVIIYFHTVVPTIPLLK